MVKSKEETAYLLQTCGDNFVIREFRADVKYDMLAKPVYTKSQYISGGNNADLSLNMKYMNPAIRDISTKIWNKK